MWPSPHLQKNIGHPDSRRYLPSLEFDLAACSRSNLVICGRSRSICARSISKPEPFAIPEQNCPANDSVGRLKMLFVNGLR